MLKIKCKFCDREFNTYHGGNKKYCSKKCYNLGRIKKFKKICLQCNKKFETIPYKVKTGRGKYCSKKCQYLAMQNRIIRICGICGKKFEIPCSHIKQGGGKYCSLSCRAKSYSENRKGENSFRWKGGYKAFKERQKNNLKFRLCDRIRASIQTHFKKGTKANRHWEDLVGYTYKQLKRHLKSTMPDDYSWTDFINGDLHIDHIIPIKEFKFSKPEDLQFKQCWILSNLRLLPAKENRMKQAKLTIAYQKSLNIAV